MVNPNKITIDENGNISIRSENQFKITINSNNEKDILEKLLRLDEVLLDALAQIVEIEKDNIASVLQTIISKLISQKNIVKGSISNVNGDVIIGDNNTRNYYYLEQGIIPKELTAQTPKLRQDQIIGRTEELNDLHNRLFNNKQVLLVNGMGGIGKTTLAQVYLSKYYEEYHHIAWVSQHSEDIVSNFINTPGLLEVFKIQIDKKNPQQIFEELIINLKKIQVGPCLMIVDNATDHLAQYYDYLPGQPNWHILVTSREKIPFFDLKELDFLNEKTAIDLFNLHYTRENLNEEFLKKLVKRLDFHTLTIEILAKTAQEQRTSPEKLLNAIEEDLETGVFVRHNKTKIERITSYLNSIFKLGNLNKEEIRLLQNFALLPSEFHSYTLLVELITGGQKGQINNFPKLLSQLKAKGWLLYNITTDSYKIHRIISDIVCKTYELNPTKFKNLLNAITSKLMFDNSKDNIVDKFIWVPFGKSLLLKFNDFNSEDMNILQNNLALILQDMGDFKSSLFLLEKTKISTEEIFGFEHRKTALSYSNLAMVHKDLGQYIEAIDLLKRAIKIYEKVLGYEDPSLSLTYSHLAMVLKDLGKYEEAQDLLLKVIKFDEKKFGLNHPRTANSYSNLGLVYNNLGKYKEAKKTLFKALQIMIKNFGSKHPNTSIGYSNFATVLLNLGENRNALSIFRKVLSTDLENYGEEHPNTIRSYSNLANSLFHIGDLNGAKKILEKVVVLDEKLLGEDHPSTILSYSNLATVLKELNENLMASILLERALRSSEKKLGNNHPTTAIICSNLASILKESGNLAGAKDLLKKAVNIHEKNLGTNHPDTALSYSNLGLIYQSLKDYKKARNLLIKAFGIMNSQLGSNHQTTKTIKANLDYINQLLK